MAGDPETGKVNRKSLAMALQVSWAEPGAACSVRACQVTAQLDMLWLSSTCACHLYVMRTRALHVHVCHSWGGRCSLCVEQEAGIALDRAKLDALMANLDHNDDGHITWHELRVRMAHSLVM